MYEIQQQQQQQQQQIKTTTTKLIQTFPQEHPSNEIISLIHLNENTLISASGSSSSSGSRSSSPSDNVIVIWTKSKSKSSSLYETIQRITGKEAGTIERLVLINQKEEEEEFASCSFGSIIIWRRRKGIGQEEMFKVKQKIENVERVWTLVYMSLTNELISGSSSPSLLQIWSPSSSSSSDFVERQKIQASSKIYSLSRINEINKDSKRIEFASGHKNGQIMIWSKQINESRYSLIRTLKPFNDHIIHDLIFLNDNGFDFLIACSLSNHKIKIFKGEEEKEEELEHSGAMSLIPMSNGQFASGGNDLNIWTFSASS